MSEESYPVKEISMEKRSLKQVFMDALDLFLTDVKNTKWAVIFLIAYFVFSKKIFHTICPLVALTGFPCPGCGLTRAGISVLRLDFVSAWRFHPFIFPILLFILLFVINRYLCLKKNEKFLRWYAIVILVLMIGFYIWRMCCYFPGEPPMSYYRYNLLRDIFVVIKSIL